MEWLLLYMVVSALILEGLILFVKEHSFHNIVMDGLAVEIEADNVVMFIALLLGYLCVVAYMPLFMFFVVKD